MMEEKVKVKATELGYYEHMRRREGDVFELVVKKDKNGKVISPMEQFSKRWMELVPVETPEKVSTMTKVDSSNLDIHNEVNVAKHKELKMKENPKNDKSSGDEEVI